MSATRPQRGWWCDWGGVNLAEWRSERSCNSALPSLEVDALLFCLTPQCLLWLPVWCLQVSVTLY